MQSIVDIEICEIHTDLNIADPLTKFLSQAKHDHSLGVNHIVMWTRLLTLVNPLGISHMEMWTNHIKMWTRLLTLVQVGDWRKYALEAIIKLLFIFPYIMINVYYSC